MKYNWQQKDWPNFTYELSSIEDALFAFASEAGQVSGVLKAMSEESQVETVLNMMVSEAVKTSEIEGEYFSRQDVVSSIRNNLGLNKKPAIVKDKKAQGAGELMVAVRKHLCGAPLTQTMLFSWHKILMSQSKGITVGAWRKHKEPMQIYIRCYWPGKNSF